MPTISQIYARAQCIPKKRTETTFAAWRDLFQGIVQHEVADHVRSRIPVRWTFTDEGGENISSQNPSFTIDIVSRIPTAPITERYVFIGQGQQIQVYGCAKRISLPKSEGEIETNYKFRTPWLDDEFVLSRLKNFLFTAQVQAGRTLLGAAMAQHRYIGNDPVRLEHASTAAVVGS